MALSSREKNLSCFAFPHQPNLRCQADNQVFVHVDDPKAFWRSSSMFDAQAAVNQSFSAVTSSPMAASFLSSIDFCVVKHFCDFYDCNSIVLCNNY